MYYLFGYYWDPTYILVVVGGIVCIWASMHVNSVMKKYQKQRNASGMTGAQAAERILHAEGIYDVTVECLSRDSGDHYDPRSKTVRLSNENYNNATVTAVAVAAHECGHAKQHNAGYGPLNFRSMLAPVAGIGSRLGIPIILIGLLLSSNQMLIQIGIWVFALAVLFQLVTLPVEFNASKRALQTVEQYGILGTEETAQGRKVLNAAALTYVAAAAAAVLQLLRLVLLFGRRSDD